MDRGYVGPVQSFYEMSKDWYRNRTEAGWDPYTAEEAMEIWARHGFTGEFWRL